MTDTEKNIPEGNTGETSEPDSPDETEFGGGVDATKPRIRVYLDNCCYSRPYDSQSSDRIVQETEAKLKIQQLIWEN